MITLNPNDPVWKDKQDMKSVSIHKLFSSKSLVYIVSLLSLVLEAR